MLNLPVLAQLLIAGSVVFVWIFRLDGIVKEFEEYHLSATIRNMVGALKISLATLLVAGIWYHSLVFIPAIVMAILMACAVFAHVAVKHAALRSAPAFVLLLLSLYVAISSRGAVPQ
jgi:DoxX-like family